MDTVHKNLNSKGKKMQRQSQNYFCILNSYQMLLAYLTFTKEVHIYESYSHSKTKSSEVISPSAQWYHQSDYYTYSCKKA